MRYRIGLLAGLAGLLIVSTVATAATRYVSDELSINMRRGPGTGYRITQLLDAGEKLETLSEDSGWTQIRTAGGATGYVLTRFLSDEPAARTQIDQLKAQTQQLESENADLKSELSEALSGSEELGNTKRELVAENKSLSSQLQQIRETSADAIRISDENEKFREQLLSMRSDNERLRHENEALQSRREGMKIGALIMIGGIVVGLLLPLFRKRRKGSWDSL
ncbi:TIGR04211 family SH3 domain-containing protein [Salinisphaera sp. T31B1]|uniref:TIGR04211 family SH3 domain-containing protein n=1 Tax=Salinisphaera sp. T31B1 TaxID=727963 RepID=UPI0033402773